MGEGRDGVDLALKALCCGTDKIIKGCVYACLRREDALGRKDGSMEIFVSFYVP